MAKKVKRGVRFFSATLYLKRTNSNRNPVWTNLAFIFSKDKKTIIELVHKTKCAVFMEIKSRMLF